MTTRTSAVCGAREKSMNSKRACIRGEMRYNGRWAVAALENGRLEGSGFGT
jgi:hypothetical protein